jgi:LacI family transcriptional regulator
VSQRDVAREAGTSVAVVSYVLNNGPRPVAEATRQRVLDAMARLGYRPNSLAAALRSQRSTLVGMLVPDLMHPFFAGSRARWRRRRSSTA